MSNIINLKDFSPKFGDQYFFDNNVWMFLNYPIGNYGQAKQRDYAEILDRIRNVKCNIFINSLVISEFTNAWIRKAFDVWATNNHKASSTFKSEFVGTKEYITAVGDIESATHQILKIAQPGTDDFNAIGADINPLFANFKFCDFNDCYYLELARRKKWIIVSDDSDLLGKNVHSVKIVTARKIA